MPTHPTPPHAARLRARRAGGWIASVAVLVAVALALRGRWTEASAAGGLPGPAPVAAAVLLNVAANAVLVQAWRRVLDMAATPLAFRPAAWVWSTSQFARYTVGGAQVAGRAVVGRRYGLGVTAGALTTLVEVAWQTAIAGALLLATLPWWLQTGSLRWLGVAAVLPAAALVVGTARPRWLLLPVARALYALPAVRRRLPGLPAVSRRLPVTSRAAVRVTLLHVANTALRLGAFLVLFVAVGGDLASGGLRAIGADAAGQLLGRLAVFAPGGLGPREGATALVVAPAIGGGAALLLVAAVRLLEVVAELAFLALARLLRPEATAGR